MSRRRALTGLGASIMVQQPIGSAAGEPTWLAATAPEDEGFATDLGKRLDQAIADKQAWNLHGLVVLRNGRSVLQRYFEGEDRARGVGALGWVVAGEAATESL